MTSEKALEDKMAELALNVIEDAMGEGATAQDRIQALRHLTAFHVGSKKLKLKDGEADDGKEGIFGTFRKKLEKTQGAA